MEVKFYFMKAESSNKRFLGECKIPFYQQPSE